MPGSGWLLSSLFEAGSWAGAGRGAGRAGQGAMLALQFSKSPPPLPSQSALSTPSWGSSSSLETQGLQPDPGRGGRGGRELPQFLIRVPKLGSLGHWQF